MKLRPAASVFSLAGAAAVALVACATQSQSNGGERYAEVHTELAAYEPDLVSREAPVYPIGPRGRRFQGTGVFRLTFDYDSGRAVEVKIVRSPGNPSLEQAAIAALKKWAVKPRTWHNIEVVVRFAAAPQGAPVSTRVPAFRPGKLPTFRPFRAP